MKLIEIINKYIETDWKDILKGIEGMDDIDAFLEKDRETYEPVIHIFPPENLIFAAFNYFNVNETKVVILGQDPYYNEGEAMGLSFSVPDKIKIPPSLRNIYKELSDDLDIDVSNRNGNLTHWAQQGVLLINKALTVRQYKAHTHKKPWSKAKFVNQIIDFISDNLIHVVFILWGKPAQTVIPLIDENKHCILKSPHPSPLSAYSGFFGSKLFSQCNQYLSLHGKEMIKW